MSLAIMLGVLASCAGDDSPRLANGSGLQSTSRVVTASPTSAAEAGSESPTCHARASSVFVQMAYAVDRLDLGEMDRILAPAGKYSSIRTPLLQTPSTDRRQAAAELQKVHDQGQRVYPTASPSTAFRPGGMMVTSENQLSDVKGQPALAVSADYGRGGRLTMRIDCTDFRVVEIGWISFSS